MTEGPYPPYDYDMNIPQLKEAFNRIYGPDRGEKICYTVLPGVLSDFNRMLNKEKPGVMISEEYRLEDGKSLLILEGQKDVSGKVQIDAVLKKA